MSRPPARTLVVALLVVAVAAAAIAASATMAARDRSRRAAAQPHFAAAVDYLPGLAAQVFLPAPGTPPSPVVVLVPGGGWTSADPGGLVPLAEQLAAAGYPAVTVTYGTASTARHWPVPAQQVTCAVDFAVDRARHAGAAVTGAVVLGHSAGAQLAALAALIPDRLRSGCPYPATDASALVGLAGPYDIAAFAQAAEPLIGAPPARAAQAWHDANPLSWVGQRAGVPALIAYGSADEVVPPMFSDEFAARLRAAGHPVTVLTEPGATHGSIYRADVIGGALVGWLRSTVLAPSPS